MPWYEYAGNLHSHTPYSDGHWTHAQVAHAAAEAGLDFVAVTDHNIWVGGLEGYYGKALLLVGEEVHDIRRNPQCNHLLIYGAEAEMAPQAGDPQALIDAANERGALTFLAHPVERGSPLDPDLAAIPWCDWEHLTGFTGLEIWNYMSEFKALLRSRLHALFYAFFPTRGIRGPFRHTLAMWDALTQQGRRVVAIGGADAHGTTYRLGPLERVIFPYTDLFRAVNTHVLLEHPLRQDPEADKALIYEALRAGRAWVGYDLIAPTRGFRFWARSGSQAAVMGGDLKRQMGIQFTAQVPAPAEIRLLRNGRVVARTRGRELKALLVDPGVYRIEAYKSYRGRRCGWIFSNPIYVW